MTALWWLHYPRMGLDNFVQNSLVKRAVNLALNTSRESLFKLLFISVVISLSLKVSVLLHILMDCISFIVELKELFIYSGYKSSGKYIHCKYSLSVSARLFISFFFLKLLLLYTLNLHNVICQTDLNKAVGKKDFLKRKHCLEKQEEKVYWGMKAKVLVTQLCLTLWWPHGLKPARLLCPWNSPGKNIGVSFHFLLQGIFPTQESNSGLLHCRQIVYHLTHQGSPLLIYNWYTKFAHV